MYSRYHGQAAPLFGVWAAILIHLTWAATLIYSPGVEDVTAVHGLSVLLPRWGVVAALLAVVACAAYGASGRTAGSPTHRVRRVASLVPQQLALGVSGCSAAYAIWVGHFADGVMRSRGFLIADQSYIIIAFMIHTATILFVAAAPWRV